MSFKIGGRNNIKITEVDKTFGGKICVESISRNIEGNITNIHLFLTEPSTKYTISNETINSFVGLYNSNVSTAFVGTMSYTISFDLNFPVKNSPPNVVTSPILNFSSMGFSRVEQITSLDIQTTNSSIRFLYAIVVSGETREECNNFVETFAGSLCFNFIAL